MDCQVPEALVLTQEKDTVSEKEETNGPNINQYLAERGELGVTGEGTGSERGDGRGHV